ncbi:MAG: hypothetical protein Q9214_006082 [Letrouitia sp. 1 TL-2023]
MADELALIEPPSTITVKVFASVMDPGSGPSSPQANGKSGSNVALTLHSTSDVVTVELTRLALVKRLSVLEICDSIGLVELESTLWVVVPKEMVWEGIEVGLFDGLLSGSSPPFPSIPPSGGIGGGIGRGTGPTGGIGGGIGSGTAPPPADDVVVTIIVEEKGGALSVEGLAVEKISTDNGKAVPVVMIDGDRTDVDDLMCMEKDEAELDSERRAVGGTVRTQSKSEMSTKSLQDQILGACSNRKPQELRALLDEWHELLLREAIRSNSVEVVQHVIDRYGTTKKLDQMMLKESAQHDCAAVFRCLLQREPKPDITDEVRLSALSGGPQLWEVIFDHRPELKDYDFGEKGDMLGMAVLNNNVPLVTFLLQQGMDPNKGRFFGSPILTAASTNAQTKPEILNLLVQHGATEEKSLAANNAWHGV